jgi:hypothetical protein
MHPRFFELLSRSLPSPKAQAIPLAESGLPSGCGGVKLDTRWKLLHTFHKPLPVKHGFRKPDFALFPVSVNSWSFAACAFTVELQLPALDTEHRGRCATYNTAMLEANPNRLFALSAVTDLKSIMFLKSTRGTPSAAVFDLQHVYSDDLDVEQVGWDVLLTVLLRPSDWTGFFPRQMQLTGRAVELLRYLGHGATSEVWLGQVEGLPDPSNPAVIRTQELVCKMFQRDAAFHDEKKTWEGIRKREAALKDSATAASDPRLRQLVERPRLTFEGEYRPTFRTSRSSSPAPSFFGVLFFQPRGEARHRDHPAIKTAEDVLEAFACLAWLRELRIIHRDLSPRHFLRHRARLFLIDFGFALLLPVAGDLSQQSDEVSFSGSSLYAPNSVLDMLAADRNAEYRAIFAHDLESMVKLCFADRNSSEKERLKGHDRHAYQSIRDFWRECEQRMDGDMFGKRWAEALQHARNNELEETREALLPLFHHR